MAAFAQLWSHLEISRRESSSVNAERGPLWLRHFVSIASFGKNHLFLAAVFSLLWIWCQSSGTPSCFRTFVMGFHCSDPENQITRRITKTRQNENTKKSLRHCLHFVNFVSFCSKVFSFISLSSGRSRIWCQSSIEFDAV